MVRIALAVCMLVGLSAVTRAEPVVVLGDSWGEKGWGVLQSVLNAHGAKDAVVRNYAVTGSTAHHWAQPSTLKHVRWVVTAPGVRHVWITLGGNDAIHKLPVCGILLGDPDDCVATLTASVKANLQVLISAVLAANPSVNIVGFGYDIFHLGGTPECSLLGNGLFPSCDDAPLCVNKQVIKMQTIWDDLAAANPRVTSINLLGTMQQAGGVPGAMVGQPVLSAWTPGKMMQSDCVHPNQGRGFPALFTAMWQLYWHKALAPPQPPNATAPVVDAANATRRLASEEATIHFPLKTALLLLVVGSAATVGLLFNSEEERQVQSFAAEHQSLPISNYGAL